MTQTLDTSVMTRKHTVSSVSNRPRHLPHEHGPIIILVLLHKVSFLIRHSTCPYSYCMILVMGNITITSLDKQEVYGLCLNLTLKYTVISKYHQK